MLTHVRVCCRCRKTLLLYVAGGDFSSPQQDNSHASIWKRGNRAPAQDEQDFG